MQIERLTVALSLYVDLYFLIFLLSVSRIPIPTLHRGLKVNKNYNIGAIKIRQYVQGGEHVAVKIALVMLTT